MDQRNKSKTLKSNNFLGKSKKDVRVHSSCTASWRDVLTAYFLPKQMSQLLKFCSDLMKRIACRKWQIKILVEREGSVCLVRKVSKCSVHA